MLTLEKALDLMSDVVHCPRCSIGCLGDEDYNAQCPKCCFVFCSLCKDPRHPGKECLTPEQKLQRLQASGKMTASGMVEEMMSIKMLYGDARSCPKCKMTISKTEGCNKVVCISCGQAFCFLCGKAIISGYGHFSKRRDLFEPGKEDTKDWQNQMDWLEIRNRIRAQKHPVGSTVKCPKCRQKNLQGQCWIYFLSGMPSQLLHTVQKAGRVYGATEWPLGVTAMCGDKVLESELSNSYILYIRTLSQCYV